MYFTAAALKPPAGLNQIPSFLTSVVVSKTELPKSGTQTQLALPFTEMLLQFLDVWKYGEPVLVVVLLPSQRLLKKSPVPNHTDVVQPSCGQHDPDG